MMIRKVLIGLFSLLLHLNALTFSEALHSIQNHESVESANFQYEASVEKINDLSSWSDPIIRVAAKNFPLQTLRHDDTPMTGIDIGVSQKIPLTSKYDAIKREYSARAKVHKHTREERVELLKKDLWSALVLQRKFTQELEVLQENRVWLEKMLEVSTRLYTTGKVSSQSTLDLQIRLSEVQSDISTKRYELLEIEHRLFYLVGEKEIEKESIPWRNLLLDSGIESDNRELALQEKLHAQEHSLVVSKLDIIPDITVALAYTKRSNLDGVGDFISSSVSFPLPLSDKKSSRYSEAFKQKLQAREELAAYKREKRKQVSLFRNEIEKLERELEIIENSMMDFALSSRDITARSYSVGDSTYIELLQSEMKLQKIQLRKIAIESKIDIQRVALKYIRGERL